jgi:hypothetical protein
MTNKEQKETVEQILTLKPLRDKLTGADLDALNKVIAELRDRAGVTVSMTNTADLLQVSRQTVDNWVKAGTLPVVNGLNGRQQIPRKAVERAASEVQTWRSGGRQRVATALRGIADELHPAPKPKRKPAAKKKAPAAKKTAA